MSSLSGRCLGKLGLLLLISQLLIVPHEAVIVKPKTCDQVLDILSQHPSNLIILYFNIASENLSMKQQQQVKELKQQEIKAREDAQSKTTWSNVLESDDEAEVIGSLIASVWNSVASFWNSSIESVKDSIDKTAVLIDMDTSNRNFQYCELKYTVTEIPYYVIIKDGKVIGEDKVDGTFLYIIHDKFKDHKTVTLKDPKAQKVSDSQSSSNSTVAGSVSNSNSTEVAAKPSKAPEPLSSSLILDRLIAEGKVNLYSPYVPYLANSTDPENKVVRDNPLWTYRAKNSYMTINPNPYVVEGTSIAEELFNPERNAISKELAQDQKQVERNIVDSKSS